MDQGMLAHLRDRFHVPAENLATEALAYILRNAKARAAFNQLIQRPHPDLPEIIRFETQDVTADDTGIPDLVGLSADNRKPFLGEVKFDAGLTRHQPVSYIQRLQQHSGRSLLLFLVPEARAYMVWTEIRRRCNGTEGVQLGPDLSSELPMMRASVDDITVALTTWKEVLNVLESALRKDEDEQTLWDVRQLRAMCDRQDSEAFVPLTSQDLESRIAHRYYQLIDLSLEATESLALTGVATGLGNAAYIRDWSGRYVYLGGWNCWLGISWEHWRSKRATPIWLVITDPRALNDPALAEALSELKLKDPPLLLSDGHRHIIPIHLKEHADRDSVLEDMNQQVREIAALLEKAPPPSPDNDQASS